MSRSKAREHALKVLYAKEINPNTAEISADISDALSEKGKSFSDFLVEQVQLHRDEIDGEIVRFLKKWSLSQLNIVDKNILRIAIAEFNYTYEDKADRKVIINEAVELAKVYGGQNSYRRRGFGVPPGPAEKTGFRCGWSSKLLYDICSCI